MATLIEMPKLSDTMTVGTLVNWLKKEGDAVSNGDMIAEVETDKATMEVECFEEGILIKQYCKQGEEVLVGGAIAAVGEAGEAAPEAPNNDAAETQTDAPKPETPAKAEAPKPQEPAVVEVAKAVEAPVSTNVTVSNSRVKASPLAKKIAANKGIDLSSVQGSGPGGRILKSDLEGIAAGSLAAKNNQAATKAPPAPTLEALSIPVSNMRKSIAGALVASKTQAPHFYLQIEVDGAPLSQLRKQLNDKLASLPVEQGGNKFSVNDLTLKAAAEAVKLVPAINRSWAETTITQHANVDLAFGVAMEDGLVTPVIRAAETKSLQEVSMEAKVLIKKARDKKLAPNEMSGSTLTVTNLGMFGISDFYGIINPTNAAILSVGATIKRPIVNKEGAIVVGETMKIGLSGDHRVIDGAVGAQYLQALKSIIEAPALMLL